MLLLFTSLIICEQVFNISFGLFFMLRSPLFKPIFDALGYVHELKA
jgi:hypothetical protein